METIVYPQAAYRPNRVFSKRNTEVLLQERPEARICLVSR